MVITLTLIYMSINYLRTIFERISGQTLFSYLFNGQTKDRKECINV